MDGNGTRIFQRYIDNTMDCFKIANKYDKQGTHLDFRKLLMYMKEDGALLRSCEGILVLICQDSIDISY